MIFSDQAFVESIQDPIRQTNVSVSDDTGEYVNVMTYFKFVSQNGSLIINELAVRVGSNPYFKEAASWFFKWSLPAGSHPPHSFFYLESFHLCLMFAFPVYLNLFATPSCPTAVLGSSICVQPFHR